MSTYADRDAEQVARGIRLGGQGDQLDAAPDSEPLTVAGLERLTRSDIYEPDEDFDPDYDDPPEWGPEGQLRVYKVSETYTIAADWCGWLPGHYVTRDAALVAYGYVLGGEGAGVLGELATPGPDGLTVEDLEQLMK